MSYFLIFSGESGIKIEKLSKEEILERINPDEFGCSYYGMGDVLEELPDIEDGYFKGEGGILIIKGEVIVPTLAKYQIE